MNVYSETNSFIFEVIYLIEVPEQYIPNQNQTGTAAFQHVLLDCELAPFAFRLVEVQGRTHNKLSAGNL